MIPRTDRWGWGLFAFFFFFKGQLVDTGFGVDRKGSRVRNEGEREGEGRSTSQQDSSQRCFREPPPCPSHRRGPLSLQMPAQSPAGGNLLAASTLLFFISERKLSNLAAQLLSSHSSPREVKPCQEETMFIHREAVSLVRPDGWPASQWVHRVQHFSLSHVPQRCPL